MKGALAGPLMASLGVMFFSANDVIIKYLSGDYALHEVVFFRSAIAILVTLCVMVPLSGGLSTLRTRRLPEHLLRASCVITANMCFFLALTTLDLADAVAIFFAAPLMLTVMSVLILKEKVGPQRWTAVIAGFIGVLIVARPGTESFQPASLLPLVAALAYASLHIMSRRLGRTESATAMAFYIQLTFLTFCILFGAVAGAGQFDHFEGPELSFLFRPWIWPPLSDLWMLVLIGVATSLGAFCISGAYKVSEAALVAPFEYVALPLSIFWGIVVFGTWPDPVAGLGIALILGSGVFIAVRENRRPATRRA